MSLTMLSVVIVLSAVGSVSSSAMVADDWLGLAGQLPADPLCDADGETPKEDARPLELLPGEFRSVLRAVRRLEPAPAPRTSLPAVDRVVLAARPLPVAADLPLPAPQPAAIWPSVRFSTPPALVPTARSQAPAGRPQLSLACQAPRAADLGQQVRYRLVVRNTGDGVAEQVVVEPHMVAGADSRSRVPRWFPVGDLAPGASREIVLRTVARRAESLQVRFFASDRNGSEAEAGVQVQVRRPAVEITVAGPDAITLGDEAMFEIRAGNTGAAAAEPVSVACSVGDGLRLTVVDQQVQFAAKAGQLVWALGRLAAGETKVLRFQARPLIAGEQRIRVAVEDAAAGSGGNSRAAATEKTITIRDRTVDERTASL
jgi:hypothetical protein